VPKQTPAVPVPSMPTWETLEEFVRTKIQATMQAVLEEELTAFLGRGKSERRSGVDPAPGYRNGRGRATWTSASRAGCCRCSRDRAAR